MTPRRGAIIPGLLLILLGGWFLADNLGAPLPNLGDLWPAFPLFFGLAFLIQFFTGGRRDDGLIFVGVGGALVGAFFFAFTLGPLEWAQMGTFWPVFILIGSAAFFGQWLARPRNLGLLIPAIIALVVGGVFLLGNAGALSPAMREQLIKFWPVLLIFAGLLTLAGYFFRAPRRDA